MSAAKRGTATAPGKPKANPGVAQGRGRAPHLCAPIAPARHRISCSYCSQAGTAFKSAWVALLFFPTKIDCRCGKAGSFRRRSLRQNGSTQRRIPLAFGKSNTGSYARLACIKRLLWPGRYLVNWEIMDENFAYLIEKLGPAFDKRDVPRSSIERYRGKLPDQLLAYWEEYGWCGYGDGLFWTVNPQEYEPALEAWIGDTQFMEQDAYHIIARSAFGDLYFFGERTGSNLQIVAADANAIADSYRPSDLNRNVKVFFSSLNKAGCDHSDVNGVKLFARALKKLGRLKHDEMYGFAPALALGGPASLDHLQRVKAVEHLVLLAQLAPLNVISV